MAERDSGPANAEDRRFSPGAIDYNGAIAGNYRAGRALPSQTLELWLSAVSPFIKAGRAQTILDLGAGTGRFSWLLAERFQARVIAVEPSQSMLAAATKDQSSPPVAYVAAKAENIPLRDKSCDVAWLSQVFHHIRDHRACVRELHRILRANGLVLIRGAFGDRLDGFPTLFRFFPGTRLICEGLPTTSDAAAVFASEGFTFEADRRIQQRTCGSLREFAQRTRLRADTALALIPDQGI